MMTTARDYKGATQIVWTPGVSLETIEQQIIEAAYGFYKGNKTATAQSLGISIRTLDNKLERYLKERNDHESRVIEARSAREEHLQHSRFGRPKAEEARPSEASRKSETRDSPEAGVRSESASKSSAQHGVPVSEPKEVQGVLSGKNAPSSSGKRR